jgi:esterase/lipase
VLTRLFAVAGLCALLIACGGGDDGASTTDSPDVKVSPGASGDATKPAGEPSPAPGAISDETIRFETADGVTVVGHLYSSGGPKRKVVVLAHEFGASQKSWTAFARELAAKGVDALTFDFRGYGETGGAKDTAKVDRDLESAVRFIRSRDYAQTYVFGASMGGTAALKVAARLDLAGVATLSSPASIMGLDASQDVNKITEPKLFIAGTRDDGGTYAQAVSAFMKTATAPKNDAFFDSDKHGTALLSGPSAADVKKLLFDFLGV